MTNIKKLQPNVFTIIGIYNIAYVTIKKSDIYENIYNVNPLYLLVNHASGYIQ